MSGENVILFGSTHNSVDEGPIIISLLQKFKPEVVLLEELQERNLNNLEDYRSLLKENFISPLVEFSTLKPILEYCKNNNLQARGLDYKDYLYNKKEISIINSEEEPTEEDIKAIEKKVKLREMHQLKRIQEETKNNKKVLIITGAWHLRKESPITKQFTKAAYYMPCNSGGAIIYGQEEESDNPITHKKLSHHEIL